MKLHYCADLANFGDRLNPYIWSALLPGVLDEDERYLLVGIGTLLNGKVPRRPMKLVFGTGVGYGEPSRVDERWRVYCLRGPLSAQALGVDPALAVTDPAILVRHMPRPYVPTRNRPAFFPHYLSARYADWRAVAEMAGFDYIDPAAPVEQVIDALGSAPLVITEALHGAVVADALRVPWVPVMAYRHICRFKWADWCASLGLAYEPRALSPLWDLDRYARGTLRLKVQCKAALAERGVHLPWGSPARPLYSGAEQIARVVEQLAALPLAAEPRLSTQAASTDASERLEELLVRLRADAAAAASRPAAADRRTSSPWAWSVG